MKKQIVVLSMVFMLSVAGSAKADTPSDPPLPEGTPSEIEGYNSRELYSSYYNSISKDIEETSRKSLDKIRTGFLDFRGPWKVLKHGVSFSYYPAQTSESEKAFGEIYYSCDREENCDWIMKVVAVPIVDARDWAYNNFDASTAVSNLKARGDIDPSDSISQLGFLMKLPSPKQYISSNAKKQLYYGNECPGFTNSLGNGLFGDERARYLLNVATLDEKARTPRHVKGAVFEFSIAENVDALKVYYPSPVIELKLAYGLGNETGDKLFESIKDCSNRAAN